MKIPFTNIEIVQRSAFGGGKVVTLHQKDPAKLARAGDWNQKRRASGRNVRMYAGAQVSRLTSDWPASISSADAEIQVSAIALRSRNRQLERDDDYFRRILRLFENNVIGHQGICLQMKIKDRVAGKGGKAAYKYDTDANSMVQNAWKKYLKKENCTVTRGLSGLKLQRLAERALKRDGAIIVRLFRGFNNEFKFAVQLLEIDFLNFYFCGRVPGSNNLVKFGIEMDSFGAAEAYWILNRHPGEVSSQDGFQKAFHTRVPADEIFIIENFDRANQNLGMPDTCSAGTRLNMLHKTLEAVAVATRAGAAKMGFIETERPVNSEYKADELGNPIEELSPGTVEQLQVGQKFTAYDPQQPGDALPAFIKEELRGVGAGSAVNYADLANDLESVNYSSLKAGRLETKAQYEFDQALMIEDLMQPWFEAWLPFAILSGQIAMPATKAQKILDGANWQARVWQSVEPMKEVQADLLEISGKLASRREKIAERGRNIDDVDEEQEEDMESLKAHGLDELDAVKPVIQSGPETPDGEAKPAGK